MRFTPAVIIALTCSVAACKRGDSTPSPPAAPSASVAQSADPEVAKALAAYDRMCGALVQDTGAGVSAAAAELAASARSAAPNAAGSARGALEAMAATADRIQAMPAEPVEPLRVTFGDLSQHVVHLLAVVPRFREGRQVRQCPRVPGYKKWVRASDSGRTPYMGSMMPACDEPADFAE